MWLNLYFCQALLKMAISELKTGLIILMCIVIKIASDFHKYKMLPKKGTLYAAISLVTEL